MTFAIALVSSLGPGLNQAAMAGNRDISIEKFTVHSQRVPGPFVVTPGYRGTWSLPLVNSSTTPGRVLARLDFRCWDASYRSVSKTTSWRTISVPGDPAPRATDRGHKVLAKPQWQSSVPKECRKIRDGKTTFHDVQISITMKHLTGGFQGTITSSSPIGWSFSYRNKAKNLTLSERKPPGSHDAHHTMPVKFRKHFERADLNIDDPYFLLWWCSTKGYQYSHQKWAYKYNSEWSLFFQKNSQPSRAEILAKRLALVQKYRGSAYGNGYKCR